MPEISHTSKQLVARTLQGLVTPRVPTGPLAVHFCARIAGVSLNQYTHRARILADSVIRYHERFRPDAVWLSADTWVSAEAMGARVGSTGPDQPTGGLGPPLIQSAGDIDRIPPPAPDRQGRYPLMIEALSHIVEALGRDVFIVACFDQYPFSLAAALLGLSQMMLKLHDDPPLVAALMERCLEYGLAYAQALSQVGPDLLSGGDSPAGLLGPQGYGAVAWPLEKRLITTLKASTRKSVSLHICGNTSPILTEMARTEADVLEIDHAVDLEQACRLVGPDTTIWGNLDPVGLLAQGSPEQVSQATRQTIETAKRAGRKRFVLSSGCTLAVETPPENLDAMLRAVSFPQR
jgi:uroporphyrinogen decarboxylase